MNERLTFDRVAELEARTPRARVVIDGPALRARLIAEGVLRPAPSALVLRHSRLPAGTAVFRLDDVGRAAATQYAAQYRQRGRELPVPDGWIAEGRGRSGGGSDGGVHHRWTSGGCDSTGVSDFATLAARERSGMAGWAGICVHGEGESWST